MAFHGTDNVASNLQGSLIPHPFEARLLTQLEDLVNVSGV